MKPIIVLAVLIALGCKRAEPVKLTDYTVSTEVIGGQLRQTVSLTNGISMYFTPTNIVIWPSTNSSIVYVYNQDTRIPESIMIKLPGRNGLPDQAVLDVNADGVPDIRTSSRFPGKEIFFKGEWFPRRVLGTNVVITNRGKEVKLFFDGRRYVDAM